MTGPKTNEGATKANPHVGTRAKVRYSRVSAYKAREVLNLIRGRDVRTADEILSLTERDVAYVIRKCLASAVANAQNNDSQDPEELFVRACYADEGPTLKRFRPRARGRGFRIRKRTCHITVVVDRMPDAELERRRRVEESSNRRGRTAASQAASRRERVARSRAAAAVAKGEEAPAAPEAGPYAGSVLPPADGSIPAGYEVKGNADSMLYHEPGGRYYAQTKAEFYFASAEAAEAAGFAAPGAATADAQAAAEGEDA
jgi:large subunit ribosomal protein L22